MFYCRTRYIFRANAFYGPCINERSPGKRESAWLQNDTDISRANAFYSNIHERYISFMYVKWISAIPNGITSKLFGLFSVKQESCTNFKVIGSTRLEIKPESTALEADALTIVQTMLLPFGHRTYSSYSCRYDCIHHACRTHVRISDAFSIIENKAISSGQF